MQLAATSLLALGQGYCRDHAPGATHVASSIGKLAMEMRSNRARLTRLAWPLLSLLDDDEPAVRAEAWASFDFLASQATNGQAHAEALIVVEALCVRNVNLDMQSARRWAGLAALGRQKEAEEAWQTHRGASLVRALLDASCMQPIRPHPRPAFTPSSARVHDRRRHRARWCSAAALWVGVLALGCGDHDTPKGADQARNVAALVEILDWSSVPRSDDPFTVDQDAPPACSGADFRVEDSQSWLEIDTGRCSWVTLSAPARLSVNLGQELELELSHYDLEAPEPAHAELELTLEGCQAFSKTIPIPSEANVYMEHFSSPCALTAGKRVLFHLHNHGQNTYQLRGLSVLR